MYLLLTYLKNTSHHQGLLVNCLERRMLSLSGPHSTNAIIVTG